MNTTTSTRLRTLVAGAILSTLCMSFPTVSNADGAGRGGNSLVPCGRLQAAAPLRTRAQHARVRLGPIL